MALSETLTDEALKGLRIAFDPKRLARRIAEARGEEPGRIASIEMVRHRPGRRCVLRCEHRDSRGSVRVLYAKLYRNQRGAATAEIHRALERIRESSPEFPPVPRLYAYLDRERLLLTEEIAGVSLAGRGIPADSYRRAGRALAHLHRARFPLAREHSSAAEAGVLRLAAGRLARARPHLSARVAAVVERLERAILSAAPERAILHRDFHPAQVIVGETVAFLDLDEVSWGDPALDVGNFLAHLALPRRPAGPRAGPGAPAALESCSAEWDAFLGGYRGAEGPARSDRIPAARAATCARLAGIEAVQDAGSPLVERLLESAERTVLG